MARCEEPLFFRKYEGDRFRWIPVHIAIVVLDTIVVYNESEGLLMMRSVESVTRDDNEFRNTIHIGNLIEFPLNKRF